MLSNPINHQLYNHEGKDAKKTPKPPHNEKHQKTYALWASSLQHGWISRLCQDATFFPPREKPADTPAHHLRPLESPNKADWAALSPSPAPPPPSLDQLLGDLGAPPHPSMSAALKGNTPNQPSFLKTVGDLSKDTSTCAAPSRHEGTPRAEPPKQGC